MNKSSFTAFSREVAAVCSPRAARVELPLLPPREERAVERRAFAFGRRRLVQKSTPSPRPSPPFQTGERETATARAREASWTAPVLWRFRTRGHRSQAAEDRRTPRRWRALAALFLSCAPALHAAPVKTNASDAFFDSGFIPHIRIEIDKTNMAALRRDERKYVRCTIREGTNIWHEVGIHKKGAAGSNRGLDDNPALSINFDKFIDDQKFYGLDKFHLNNSVQDRTLINEAISAKIFLDAGVPAARVAHARVTLNGKDLGLYVLKEGFDRGFLKRHFKNPNGNFYDSEFIKDVTDPLKKVSGAGDVKNHADLKALAAAATDPDPTNRFARLQKVLDLPRFLDFCALEVLTWHWDGYCMNKNNFRIYHDPDADKLHFFPHGMDQMFWDANGHLHGNKKDGLVFRQLLDTAPGRAALKQHQAALLTNVFTAERITNHINFLQGYLQPALVGLNKEAAHKQSNDVHNLRNQILARIKRVNQRLLEPPPPALPFDSTGVAALTKWEIPETRSSVGATMDRTTEPDGRPALHITAKPGEKCVGSWRIRVTLPPGHYIMEALARTHGVTALTNDTSKTKGIGAGIRLSNHPTARTNALVGTNLWTKLEYPFSVGENTEETTLLCELRAAEGQAWFDERSLKVRKSQPPVEATAPKP